MPCNDGSFNVLSYQALGHFLYMKYLFSWIPTLKFNQTLITSEFV